MKKFQCESGRFVATHRQMHQCVVPATYYLCSIRKAGVFWHVLHTVGR